MDRWREREMEGWGEMEGELGDGEIVWRIERGRDGKRGLTEGEREGW